MKFALKQYVVGLLICCEILMFLGEESVVFAGHIANKQPPTSCNLVLGVSNWLPYQHLSDKGVATGKQIKLVKQIVRETGCKLSYKPMTFPKGLGELKKGNIDFLMNASPSNERKKFGHFSIPYRQEFLLLYSTVKYLEKCQAMTLTELIEDGFRLGLQKKLVYGPELTRIQQDPRLSKRLLYVIDNVQHVPLVKEMGLDGIVDDPVVVSYRSTVNLTGDTLSSCPIVISSSPISFIFSKKTVPIELVNRFDRVIKKIKGTEGYKRDWGW